MIGIRLGQSIRARRLQLGLTQAQLSERASVSLKYIARLESGNELRSENPTIATLARISIAMSCSIQDLLNDGMHRPVKSKPKPHMNRRFVEAVEALKADQAKAILPVIEFMVRGARKISRKKRK